jgi:hypothetical protein
MTQASTAPSTGKQESQFGIAQIRGRIASVREIGGARGGFAHVIKLPAPDQYTSPATVEVVADERLGPVDSEWAGKVQIGGFGRSWTKDVEDRNGVVRKVSVPTADNKLTAVL